MFPTPESPAGDLSMPPQSKFLNNLFGLPLSKQKTTKESLFPLTINPNLLVPAYTGLSNQNTLVLARIIPL